MSINHLQQTSLNIFFYESILCLAGIWTQTGQKEQYSKIGKKEIP
jgi:hypothetical protein